jgi:hypothetical protein
MTEIADRLKTELLQLTEEDREELAYHLLQSLHDRDDGVGGRTRGTRAGNGVRRCPRHLG